MSEEQCDPVEHAGSGDWLVDVLSDIANAMRRENLPQSTELAEDLRAVLQMELARKQETANKALKNGRLLSVISHRDP